MWFDTPIIFPDTFLASSSLPRHPVQPAKRASIRSNNSIFYHNTHIAIMAMLLSRHVFRQLEYILPGALITYYYRTPSTFLHILNGDLESPLPGGWARWVHLDLRRRIQDQAWIISQGISIHLSHTGVADCGIISIHLVDSFDHRKSAKRMSHPIRT
jgi:hypothetical protein